MYVTSTEWADSAGHLTDGMSTARVTAILEGASRFLDRLMGRATPLEPHVSTRVLSTYSRTLSLGYDFPPVDEDRWLTAVESCVLLDRYGETVATLDVADVSTALPGALVLSTDAPLSTSGFARVRYAAGYGAWGAALTPTGWTAAAGVATATTPAAHGLVAGQVVRVAGTTPADYSGTWRVRSAPTSVTATARIGSTPAASSASGTLTPVVPDIPDALREAAIELARSIALRDLDQRDPLNVGVSGVAKARAAEMAAAFAVLPSA